MDRKKVYEAIDKERNYQDILVTGFRHNKADKAVPAELVLMQVYLNKAANDFVDYKGDEKALHQIRKVVALGVRCLENHGCPRRVGVSEENKNVKIEDYIDEEVPDVDPAIPFTEEEVKKYLDNCIRFWRERRNAEKDKLAGYYIDAYQSVRISIFGKLLEGGIK